MLNVSFWKLWRLWCLWQSDNFMLAGYPLRTVRDRNPFGTLRESAPLKHHRDMTKTWIKNVEIFSDSNMNIQISMNLKFISCRWCSWEIFSVWYEEKNFQNFITFCELGEPKCMIHVNLFIQTYYCDETNGLSLFDL